MPAPRAADAGVASVEFLGMLSWLLIAALAAWQMTLIGAAATSAATAARAASRALALGGDPRAVALASVDTWLAAHTEVEAGPAPGCDDDEVERGTRVVVCIDVPFVVPGVEWQVRRAAELPAPGG